MQHASRRPAVRYSLIQIYVPCRCSYRAVHLRRESLLVHVDLLDLVDLASYSNSRSSTSTGTVATRLPAVLGYAVSGVMA